MTALLVIVGGMIGAPLRYLISHKLRRETWPDFAWGTFTVNTLGSFLLGLTALVTVSQAGTALWSSGLCGALTTYSTLSYDTVALWEARASRHAIINMASNIAAGLCAMGAARVLLWAV